MMEVPYLNAMLDSINNTDFQIASFARNTPDELHAFLNKPGDKDPQAIQKINYNAKFRYDIIPVCTATFKKENDGSCKFIDSLEIRMYPTNILVDKKGIARKIITGFAAPDLSIKDGNLFKEDHVTQYFNDLRSKIDSLLRE